MGCKLKKVCCSVLPLVLQTYTATYIAVHIRVTVTPGKIMTFYVVVLTYVHSNVYQWCLIVLTYVVIYVYTCNASHDTFRYVPYQHVY